MKALYIAKVDEEYSLDIGVTKKILGQINAFRNLGVDIDYIRLKNKDIYINDKFLKKSKIRYFSYKDIYKGLKRENLKYDFAYVRYARGNYNLYKTVRLLKKNNIKVIIEIPTYPYISEINIKSLKGTIDFILDKMLINKYQKYVYKISTTSLDNKIFNLDTIKISNGIDLGKFPILDDLNRSTERINLLGIGNLAKWHGYDRVIKGLSEYYNKGGNEKVHFYIVGDGSGKSYLQELTSRLKINKYVHFLGSKNGTELDEIFNDMHIGVSSLALFRAGGGHDPIKSKEFIARGLPILLAYNDKLIDANLPYVFKVEENESSIDISKLVESYNNSKFISKEVIREYARNNLTWTIQMKKVVSDIRG